MTLFDLSHRIDVGSVQKATAVRGKVAELLEDDPDVVLINSAQSQQSLTFEVLGVDTAGNKPFTERTEAKDKDEAAAIVVNGSKTKVVAEVRQAS